MSGVRVIGVDGTRRRPGSAEGGWVAVELVDGSVTRVVRVDRIDLGAIADPWPDEIGRAHV